MMTGSPTTGSIVVIECMITGDCSTGTLWQRQWQMSTERCRTPDSNTDGKQQHKHLQQTHNSCIVYTYKLGSNLPCRFFVNVFRPHCTDAAYCYTCHMFDIYLSVCVLGTLASPATTDEPIEMLFGKGKAHTGQCITLVTPGNMIIWASNEASSQITLTTLLYKQLFST